MSSFIFDRVLKEQKESELIVFAPALRKLRWYCHYLDVDRAGRKIQNIVSIVT